MCLFLLEGSPTLLPATSSSSSLFLLPATRSSPSAAPMLPTTPTTTPPPLGPALLALTVATWGATLARLVVGVLVTVARLVVSADTSPHTTGGVATERTGAGAGAGAVGGADGARVLVGSLPEVLLVEVEGCMGTAAAVTTADGWGGGAATAAAPPLEVSSTAGELAVESIRGGGGAATPMPAALASTVGETLAVTTLPDCTAVTTKDGGSTPRPLPPLLTLCEDISEPCTLPDSTTRGEVERAKGTGTAAAVVAALAAATPPPEVEVVKCWLLTMVGVTRAVGAEVVVWMPIGRMLAVGVVVTVGLTAAVGAVDWEGACVVAATLDTTTCTAHNTK